MNYALLQCKRFHKFHVWDIILLVNKNNTLLHLRAKAKQETLQKTYAYLKTDYPWEKQLVLNDTLIF